MLWLKIFNFPLEKSIRDRPTTDQNQALDWRPSIHELHKGVEYGYLWL
jgi:hypothetical protein